MLDESLPGKWPITVGGDKGYDTRDFVEGCRERNVTPHVAQNIHKRRRSAIDDRTTRQPGYAISQRFRKRIEEVFGWTKTVGQLPQDTLPRLRHQPNRRLHDRRGVQPVAGGSTARDPRVTSSATARPSRSQRDRERGSTRADRRSAMICARGQRFIRSLLDST